MTRHHLTKCWVPMGIKRLATLTAVQGQATMLTPFCLITSCDFSHPMEVVPR